MGILVLREELQPGVVRLVLNSPTTRNAMSEEMADEFKSIVSQVSGDSTVRALVLTGAGDTFSGGGHLEMLEQKMSKTFETNRSEMVKFYESFLHVQKCPFPVIAAINGHAVGAGLCLAMACDIRIAVKGAKLGLNFVKLGLHPGMGGTYLLPRLVGLARATELLMCGSFLEAEVARSIGLIGQVVEKSDLENGVRSIVSQLLEAGPAVLAQLKVTLRDSLARSFKDSLSLEAECQALNYASAEFREGITAAKEKRKPRF